MPSELIDLEAFFYVKILPFNWACIKDLTNGAQRSGA
jgi:hypothetical protein